MQLDFNPHIQQIITTDVIGVVFLFLFFSTRRVLKRRIVELFGFIYRVSGSKMTQVSKLQNKNKAVTTSATYIKFIPVNVVTNMVISFDHTYIDGPCATNLIIKTPRDITVRQKRIK